MPVSPKQPALLVTLSEAALAFVRERVHNGDAPSEEAAISGLVESARLDAELQSRFEQEEVVAAYRESLANPDAAVPISAVREHLEAVLERHPKAS